MQEVRMRNVQNIYIPIVIACIICEISQILKYLHAFLPVFLKSCIVMPEGGPHDRNM